LRFSLVHILPTSINGYCNYGSTIMLTKCRRIQTMMLVSLLMAPLG
jgi:hypothetical protein